MQPEYKTESILISIKKLVGISETDDHFDADLIIHINSVFSVLAQLGVGPADGFSIADVTTVWADFIADDARLNLVRSYMFLKVKMLFDPPTSTSVLEAMKATASEYEWRMNVAAESNKSEQGENSK